ncbi:hypothetical protein RHGRI_034586 [Rhododendron griersonianum]|uniref:Beta-glucosidase n=1 Tax=Rhododendron griersonianum TaxID=479676 RepID=A0AAV6I4J3_9ERIC|nr:hypothetical protein RHGRI_034586 [Rhododendron griersonianum]
MESGLGLGRRTEEMRREWREEATWEGVVGVGLKVKPTVEGREVVGVVRRERGGGGGVEYEGAVKEDGRGPTIWDVFSHTFGKISDFSNADVTVDQYHRFPEDIQLMKDMGMDAYRLSIAWSRIFPNGTGEINQAGVDYYNSVIDALLAAGIEPYVAIYHWDLPQALEDRYNGWLDPQIILDFTTYAETCFEKFGDRVKHWTTFNEPHTISTQGYDTGLFAPGRCSILLHLFCKAGNSATEPYIVGHNVLLAHATVADIYRTKYKQKQHGSLGISLNVIWYEPATNSTEDIEATQRAQDFQLGWFLDPLIFGDYPSSMIDRVGSRLPRFTKAESALLKGSLDFVGINHYTTFYAWHNTTNIAGVLLNDTTSDSGAITLRNIQKFEAHRTQGMDDPNSPLIPLKSALKDEKRIKYHNDYLSNLLASIKEDGCNVKGYFVWSLLDNWEWSVGFGSRFGLYFVDYHDKLKRYPKDSVKWFKTFLASEEENQQRDIQTHQPQIEPQLSHVHVEL